MSGILSPCSGDATGVWNGELTSCPRAGVDELRLRHTRLEALSPSRVYTQAPDLVPGTWYEFEIDVRGNTYTVDLTNTDTGVKVRTTTFTNTDPDRGVTRENGRPAGHIGLQSYSTSPVAFRHIQIKT